MDAWRFNRTYFWLKAPFFRYLLPLVLSIICYDAHYFASTSLLMPLGAAVGCLILFSALSFYRSTAVAKDYLLFIALQLSVFFLGIALCQLNDATRKPTWLGKNLNPNVAYIAEIDGTPAVKPKTIKLSLLIKGKIQSGQIQPLTGKAILYLYNNGRQLAFAPGTTLLIPGKWTLITNRPSPFGFNYEAYCARNGIYHQQFAAPKAIIIVGAMTANENFLQKIHRVCMQRLALHVPDKPTMGLLQAMITGDEVNLDPEMRTQYAQTGIVHIIAISGSHVANLFFLLSACLFFIKKEQHQWIKYAIGILFIWLYVLMAGAPPSAVRSAIMFSSIALGLILGKDRNTLNNLFVAAFITLLWQPMWLFSVGFQLSFVAVLSLVLFYEPVGALLRPGNKIAKAVWNVIAASFAVEILIAPLVIYYFHMLPVVSVLANLAAWGLTAFALITGMLIIVLSPFAALANSIAVFTTICIQYFNRIISFIQQFNPQSFYYFQVSVAELVLLYCCICLAAIVLLHHKWRLILPFLSVCSLLLSLFIQDKYTALRQQRLAIFYRQGSGSAAYIKGYYFTTNDSTLSTDYNAKAAFTGWHAWRQMNDTLQRAFLIHSRTTVRVSGDQLLDSTASFPADVLVLSGSLKNQSFTAIKKVFNPHRIIATDKQSATQIKSWRCLCEAQNIQFSAAQEEGTVIIE